MKFEKRRPIRGVIMRFKTKHSVLGKVVTFRTNRTLGATLMAGSIATLVVAALWAISCGGAPKESSAAPRVVSGVTLETVRAALLPEMYEAVGTIESKTTSEVGAQVGGTVRSVDVKPGDRVRAGQQLAVLDGRGFAAQLNAAKAETQASEQSLIAVEHQIQAAAAQRKFAEATYRRYKALYAETSVSRQEFDNAETQYKAAAASESALEARKAQMEASARAAKANESAAATQFGYTKIVSPAGGIVTAKLVDPGTLVMPGTRLFTIEDSDHYRVVASLSADLMTRVRIGEPVAVVLNSGRVDGRVTEIVPAADPASRTFQAKVALPPGTECLSGEYAAADFPVGKASGLSVPRSAVVERGQLEGVFVIGGQNVATYRLIKTGRAFGDRVRVLSGLSAGERVAVTGLEKLRDGVKVEAQ